MAKSKNKSKGSQGRPRGWKPPGPKEQRRALRREVDQPHEVSFQEGGAINWLKPPQANHLCSWSKRDINGKKIIGSFRTLCHLNRLNNLALHRFGTELVVIQPDWNTTVPASAGTHDYDSVWDLYIPGVDWWEQQRFFRANGLGCWYRHPPLFGNHIHGFTLPPLEGLSRGDDFAAGGFKVGIYVPGQLEDYYNEAFGLSNAHTPGSDNSWFPANKASTVFNLKTYVKRRAELVRQAA